MKEIEDEEDGQQKSGLQNLKKGSIRQFAIVYERAYVDANEVVKNIEETGGSLNIVYPDQADV